MKVVIPWNHPSRLLDCSLRFEQYLRGLSELGHEGVLVATEEAAVGWAGPVDTVPRLAALADPDLWRAIDANAAIVVTWHRMSDVLEAIGAAGTRVVAIADSDGHVGARRHALGHFRRLLAATTTLRDAGRALRHVAREAAPGAREPAPADREVLRSTRASSVVALGHGRARDAFAALLRSLGEGQLTNRLTVVPFTIGDAFLRCPIAPKEDLVVAVGRWSEPQKNAPLLAAALDRALRRRPSLRVVLFGAGGETAFRELASRHPRVEVAGVQRQETVAEAMSCARVILFSSCWEGSPHAATEAFALGATAVGTPIPCFLAWCRDEDWGRVATSPRPGPLARALLAELTAWDRGDRDPYAISGHWRDVLDPAAVCRALLAPVAER